MALSSHDAHPEPFFLPQIDTFFMFFWVFFHFVLK